MLELCGSLLPNMFGSLRKIKKAKKIIMNMTKRAYSCSLCVTSCRDMYPLKAPSLLSKQTAFLSPLDVSKRTWRCRGPGSSPFVLQAVSGSLRRVSICLHGLSIWCPGNAHRPVRPCRLQMVVNVERVPVAVRNSDGVR